MERYRNGDRCHDCSTCAQDMNDYRDCEFILQGNFSEIRRKFFSSAFHEVATPAQPANAAISACTESVLGLILALLPPVRESGDSLFSPSFQVSGRIP